MSFDLGPQDTPVKVTLGRQQALDGGVANNPQVRPWTHPCQHTLASLWGEVTLFVPRLGLAWPTTLRCVPWRLLPAQSGFLSGVRLLSMLWLGAEKPSTSHASSMVALCRQ